MTQEIDHFGIGQESSSIKSDFIESYLKPVSESMDILLLRKASQDLTKRIALFLDSFRKEIETLGPILGKYKTYRRFAKFPADFKDQSERVGFILPKPNEMEDLR
jgi:hypothetical protein